MSFDMDNWSRQSVALNTGKVDVDGNDLGGPAIFTYRSDADNVATIGGANYFADVVYDLSVDDLIYCVGSDAVTMLVVATINRAAGTITTAGASLTGSVNTANIVNDAVTNAKIADDAVDTDQIADDAVDSDRLDPTVIQYARVNVSASEFNGMYVTPKLLVAAGGANTQLLLHYARILLDYGTTQFAAGGAVHVQYDSTTLGAGTKASGTEAAAGFTGAVADTTFQLNGTQAAALASATVNKGLYLSNASGAFTTGDSTFKVDVWYSLVSYA